MSLRRPAFAALGVVLLASACRSATPRPDQDAPRVPVVNTFSIVAFDPATGDLGVAVQSRFFGVGSVVPWATAGVGAVATQAEANPAYGPDGLALLAAGKSAQEAVRSLTAADDGRARRQVGIVDARGRSASFAGTACSPWAGGRDGDGYCVQGNILAGEEVVRAMATAFEAAREEKSSELADWCLAALVAGQAAGGDRRGQQSAALLVVRDRAGFGGGNDRYVDLRVEDHPTPIAELARLLEMHKQVFAAAHARKPECQPADSR